MTAPEVQRVRTLLCNACGAPNDAQAASCTQCGGSLDDERLAAGLVAAPNAAAFQCEGCGARVLAEPAHRAVHCPFCGSPYVVERKGAATAPSPELVVPFRLERDRAEADFRQWLGRGLLRPGDLTRRAAREGVRGVYVPCWMFSGLANSRFSARIGEYWYETRVETYTTTENGKTVRRTRTQRIRHTEWFPLRGRHHHFYSRELVSGSTGLGEAELQAIQPFDPAGARRYEPAYLAGWLAEEASVDRAQAWPLARQRIAELERRQVRTFLPGDTVADLEVETEVSRVSCSLALLPCWMITWRYRDATYRFLQNGQTGRVTGKRPVSVPRVIALVAVLVALIVLAVWLGSRM